MSEQIAVRIPDGLAESLADLVAEGRFETKADAARPALATLGEGPRRRGVGGVAPGRDPHGQRGAVVTEPPRGDLWWGDAPDAKGRPYLVLTRDEAIPV